MGATHATWYVGGASAPHEWPPPDGRRKNGREKAEPKPQASQEKPERAEEPDD